MTESVPQQPYGRRHPVPEHPSLPSSLVDQLRERCASEFSDLKARFDATGDGATAIARRSAVIDALLARLYEAAIPGGEGLCLAAVGGYGRAELFPYSDLDLLFAAQDDRILKLSQEGVAELARMLWDLQLRVFHTTRTVDDCGRLDRSNFAFSISLLDLRYVAGDRTLFDRLHNSTLPHLVARDGDELARRLIDETSARHAKFRNTVFHLEPDVKEAPGGLRDWHVARWMEMIRELAGGERPRSSGPRAAKAGAAARFLAGVRCFLHFRQGRNDNLLTYELHEEAARLGLGVSWGEAIKPDEWMRVYYRHVREIGRLAAAATEQAQQPRSSLYGLFQDWRSRLSNADFLVSRGRIFPRSRLPGDWPVVLSLFEMSARHSLELSPEAGRWVEESLAVLAAARALPAAAWPVFRRILTLPGAVPALRAMHQLGALRVIVPEFQAIDALVVRDFYHHYTVDEHTFTALQQLQDLRGEAPPEGSAGLRPWRAKFAGLLEAVERLDLLTLALLLHDVGKGMPGSSHAEASVAAAASVCKRFALEAADAEAVSFLVARHLEMSATTSRRDIFDPGVVRSFAATVDSPERLKMLCLLTYADISAVNPGAMTAWKAEMLWQLYAMTEKYFSRSVDDDRLLLPAARGGDAGEGDFQAFLSGFPRRYLAAHSPLEVREHFELASQIERNPFSVRVRRREAFNEITVLAADRPLLFASVCGTLAAWGMNILKAEAFANRSGIVLDVFHFHDLHGTLEQNPEEIARLEESVAQVLGGTLSLEMLMGARMRSPGERRAKVRTLAQVSFDDASSTRCTILDLVAEDRPGLLYEVSSVLAKHGCNIEVALVETEAHKAVDVFYLTAGGAKLTAELQARIRAALLEKLQHP